ncbi:MAG: DUF2975 domain-containing protein [Bacteroidota bacterium]
MNKNKKLINLLKSLIDIVFWFVAAIFSFVLIWGVLSLFDFVPGNMSTTFEVPVRLQNLNEFYAIEDLNEAYEGTHIEVKRAELEVRIRANNWTQALPVLLISVFFGLFLGISHCLSRFLFFIQRNQPFNKRNADYLRWIGVLIIGIAGYGFLMEYFTIYSYGDHFKVSNAIIVESPSFWDISFDVIFIGCIFLIIAEAFERGNYLQELEEQTV